MRGESAPDVSLSLQNNDMLPTESVYDRLCALVDELSSASSAALKLPSERELGERLATTRITLREALSRLESEGRIYRSNRRGWFLSPPRFRLELTRKANFYRMAAEQGRRVETRLCDMRRLRPDAELQRALGVDGRVTLWEISRARAVDGRWVMAEQIYVRRGDFPDIETQDLSGSITTVMAEHYGVDVCRETTRILVGGLPAKQAAELDATSGSPCLQIRRQRYTLDDCVVDYNLEFWLPNAVELVGEGY